MFFNSINYIIFYIITVALFFLIPNRYKWFVLLVASYIFYMSWRIEYIFLIITSTLIAYLCAILIGLSEKRSRRQLYLTISILVNLGILFVFKYFNFFNESGRHLVETLDLTYNIPALDVILPVGISFYTFQTLSYTIDAYHGKVPVERHLGKFALYVSFFPQLVAGPIERSSRLLPQFYRDVTWDNDRILNGLRLILWGFFKKLVVADNLAIYVDCVYGDPVSFGFFSYVLATYLFAIQIYCDFSGYTDIAIGSARILGLDLMENFRRPYFAKSLTEFWHQWHISLSTWLRDYIYIPLGGNRKGESSTYINILVTMVLGGLWHGANWTFLIWGLIHGILLCCEKYVIGISGAKIPQVGKTVFPLNVIKMSLTFNIVCLAWIFFRAESISDALTIVQGIITWRHEDDLLSFFTITNRLNMSFHFFLAFIVILHDIFGQRLKEMTINSTAIYFSWDYILIFAILLFGNLNMNSFIYFQF